MALTGYSIEGRCLVWEIFVPNINFISESPVFSFDGSKWRFKLKIAWDKLCNEDVWTIKINKEEPTKVFHKYQVRVQVENKSGEFQFLRIVGIEFPNNSDQLLLQQTKSFLLRCYPTVMWEGSIKLIFTIYDNIFCTEDLERKSKLDVPNISTDEVITSHSTKEDKLVQTSSFMNINPCLESLSTDMQKLMDDSSQHDVALQCDGGTFYLHRAILSARSKVFRAMFQSDMLESRTNSVHIVDMDFPLLKQFLQYLYTGTFSELTVDTVMQLYETGDKYAVESLKRRCSDFLKQNLQKNNVYRILTIAENHGDTHLKEGVISYILESEMHLEDDSWNKFCDTHLKLANEILTRACKILKSSSK